MKPAQSLACMAAIRTGQLVGLAILIIAGAEAFQFYLCHQQIKRESGL